jgi:hypothetical protein
MRLRIKFKIENNKSNINCLFNNNITIYDNVFIDNMKKNSNIIDDKIYGSFSDIVRDIYNKSLEQDENILNKIKCQLKSYDEKCKKILFPVDICKINYIYQLKEILENYINVIYYNLKFISELSNEDKENLSFEVQIEKLEIDDYKICEDFCIKDILKDNDSLE